MVVFFNGQFDMKLRRHGLSNDDYPDSKSRWQDFRFFMHQRLTDLMNSDKWNIDQV